MPRLRGGLTCVATSVRASPGGGVAARAAPEVPPNADLLPWMTARPRIDYQARMASGGLSDQVSREIQAFVEQGLNHRHAVHELVMSLALQSEGMAEEALDPLVRAAVARAFDEKRAAMKSWPAQTDCERLRAAFAALERRGFVALENAGLSHSDSSPHAARLAAARDELGGSPVNAFCYFTWNDMMRAIEGSGLSIAYGTYEAEQAAQARSAAGKCPDLQRPRLRQFFGSLRRLDVLRLHDGGPAARRSREHAPDEGAEGRRGRARSLP
jgi:hypothetical protein